MKINPSLVLVSKINCNFPFSGHLHANFIDNLQRKGGRNKDIKFWGEGQGKKLGFLASIIAPTQLGVTGE